MYDVDELQVAKVKCLKSLNFHTRFFFKSQFHKKFIVGDHHAVIFEALERVLRGELKRLIINVAPRYGKTEVAVKAFISHGLALNPAAKFVHLSYADKLALDNSTYIKDLVQSPDYQLLFPNVKIKPYVKAVDKWYTTENGGVLARAAAGQVTGFGAGSVDDEADFDDWLAGIEDQSGTDLEKKFKFGGAIIIDDPIKPEDADSETIREKVNERFDSTIRTRVNSRNTPIIVIMQRLHPMDLAGYLQREDEADKWEVIELPCIKQDGTSLWPFKHTRDELDALKKANDIVFERQYMQNPKPKAGLLFPIQDLHFFDVNEFYNPIENEDSLDDPDFCIVAGDPADEGGDDFAAGTAKLIDDRIYITDILYNTDGTDFNEPAVVQMVVDGKPSTVAIEGVLGWVECAQRIRDELTDDKNYEGEFRILRPRKNKHTRITNRSAFIRNHFYFRKDYEKFPQYAKFMRNLTSYLKIQEPGRKNKRDDAPDLCEMIGSYYEKNFAHLFGTGVKK